MAALSLLGLACSGLTEPADMRVTPLPDPPPPSASAAPSQAHTAAPAPPPVVSAPPQQQAIDAMHILIQYKGSMRADDKITRTKDQARKFAAELIKRAQKEDFSTLARKYSNDPTVTQNGGDLGMFTHDRMIPSFADAAFALKPGEISKTPVETPFGFHVIKRIK